VHCCCSVAINMATVQNFETQCLTSWKIIVAHLHGSSPCFAEPKRPVTFPLDRIVSQMIPVRNLTHSFFKVHFSIITTFVLCVWASSERAFPFKLSRPAFCTFCELPHTTCVHGSCWPDRLYRRRRQSLRCRSGPTRTSGVMRGNCGNSHRTHCGCTHGCLYSPCKAVVDLNYVQSVPRSKHSVSVIKTSHLMLYREIIAVCSEIHTNT
jgi:hypothetical protein